MDSLKSILQGIFKKENLEPKLRVYQTFPVWERAVGPRIARHSHPRRFRDGTLWVVVDNPMWMQQLSFLEEELRNKINELIGSSMVEKIRFHIGELGDSSHEQALPPPASVQSADKLDDHTREEIEQQVAGVADEQLRERLRSLFTKQCQRLRHYGSE